MYKRRVGYNKTDLNKAIKVLKAGGVIAHATETCYGFACDSFNEKALKRLYLLKGMSLQKPISILVGDLKMAKKYAFFNSSAEKLAKKYWPGPLTIVLKRKKALPIFLNKKNSTVGMRLPSHAFSRNLAKKLGRPITTTSANITTLLSPYSVSEIRAQFNKKSLKPDFIVNAGRLPGKLPSTIVACSSKGIRILREGDLKIENLSKHL